LTPDKKNKIIKLLKLTQSANDHEALSAIRKVNSLLKAEGVEWDDFVGGFVGGLRNDDFRRAYQQEPAPPEPEPWKRRNPFGSDNPFDDIFRQAKEEHKRQEEAAFKDAQSSEPFSEKPIGFDFSDFNPFEDFFKKKKEKAKEEKFKRAWYGKQDSPLKGKGFDYIIMDDPIADPFRGKVNIDPPPDFDFGKPNTDPHDLNAFLKEYLRKCGIK